MNESNMLTGLSALSALRYIITSNRSWNSIKRATTAWRAARRRHSCAQSQSPLLLYFYRLLERTLMEHGARVTASRAARRIAVSIRSSNARLRAQGTADFANVIRSQPMLPNREGAIVGLHVKKQSPWRLLRFLLNARPQTPGADCPGCRQPQTRGLPGWWRGDRR